MVQVHQRHKTPIMKGASSLISVDSKVKTLYDNLCKSQHTGNPLLGSSLSNSSPSPDSDDASGVCFVIFVCGFYYYL